MYEKIKWKKIIGNIPSRILLWKLKKRHHAKHELIGLNPIFENDP